MKPAFLVRRVEPGRWSVEWRDSSGASVTCADWFDSIDAAMAAVDQLRRSPVLVMPALQQQSRKAA